MQVTYNGQTGQDFASTAFYDYCKMREGYRLIAYADNVGKPTVGIGHLITDGTPIGTEYTPDQVQQLFVDDYNNLNIEQYVTEGNYTLNQALCIGHFIWMHGAGAYDSSTYRQNWLNNVYPNESDMKAYLKANWDLNNPQDARMNADDCAVAYSTTDWSPGFQMPSRGA